MYKEQAWVEKLLKRMRNEADVQSQVRIPFAVLTLLSSNERIADLKLHF
jgi:hypothetical protein